MKKNGSVFGGANNRRSFLKNGMVAAGAATMGAALLPGTSTAFSRDDDDNAPITKGDIAILTFLSALEQVEADLGFSMRNSAEPPIKDSPRPICNSQRGSL